MVRRSIQNVQKNETQKSLLVVWKVTLATKRSKLSLPNVVKSSFMKGWSQIIVVQCYHCTDDFHLIASEPNILGWSQTWFLKNTKSSNFQKLFVFFRNQVWNQPLSFQNRTSLNHPYARLKLFSDEWTKILVANSHSALSHSKMIKSQQN